MIRENIFETNISVLVNHLNYGNHLGYDSILSIMQEARMRWLKSLDPKISEINIDNGTGWLVKKVELDITSEAEYSDILHVTLSIVTNKKSSFIISYKINNLSKNKPLCNGTTQQVCYHFSDSKVTRIPDLLIRAFG